MTAGDEEHDTTRTATVHIQIADDQLKPQRLGPRGLQRFAAAAQWAAEIVYGVDARPRTIDREDAGVRLTEVAGGYTVTVPLDDLEDGS